jgi:hypothetical protein
MFNTANWVSFCADYLELESFGLAINSIWNQTTVWWKG